MVSNPVSKTSRPRSDAVTTDHKRRFVRHAISAAAQVLDTGSGTRLNARASDLGLGGCYLDTLTPFPVGTDVQIGLHRDESVIQLPGKIVYTSLGLGMGVVFVGVAVENMTALSKWVEGLSQVQSSVAPLPSPTPATPQSNIDASNGPDGRTSVTRLVELMLTKGQLTEDDAEMILRKPPEIC
jgi:PilZ domain